MTREVIQYWLEPNIDIDALRQELGAPDNPFLFPPHFLKATFPKIGGKLVVLSQEGGNKTVVFLFPRDAQGNFTARVACSSESRVTDREIVEMLNSNDMPGIGVYTPEGVNTFEPSHKLVDGIDIGKPDMSEARQIRELQKQVWGALDDFLYPSDIHSKEFGLATTLVARQDGQPIGFLFGFYKFGYELPETLSQKYTGKFRIESQLMGVSSDSRFKGIGTNLKKEQAMAARVEGIDVINWTVDPLQLPNALLNFNKLGGICYEYHPNYYQFQNALNQVRASRLSITWLINSARVRERLVNPLPSKTPRNINQINDVTMINDGPNSYTLETDGENIAIQIPQDWSDLQQSNLSLATKWRDVTDTVLEHYIRPDRFILTEVVIDSGGKFYLLGQRLEDIAGL